ncbi:hypothetical protein [Pleurocapsa sp. PCC 7319]|uniref:hypothetical protein n=1 Tax=Pleurocapsa sp. PCC 7319 TaxID=118161 RepID=UPI0003633F33|nr:hypothetical protein [Pleurocapsa sp. PCC 7319]
MNRWEVGSEFEWSNRFLKSTVDSTWLPDTYELYSTGTASILAVYHLFVQQQKRPARIHLPSFYCMSVAAKLRKFLQVFWYQDIPTQPAPNFKSLQTQPGDLVVAFNIFGIRSNQPWLEWSAAHPEVTLIEDHSHDPFSDWAKQSKADYAISSLRKTLPIPDGGILWSPQNLPLFTAWGQESLGAYKRLTAMLLKRAYLKNNNVAKDAYRQLELESHGEMGFIEDTVVSSFTAKILPCLDVVNMRSRRAENINKFIHLSLNNPSDDWELLFDSWGPGNVPLNSVIVCHTGEIRNALRKYLIEHNIYTAVHWKQPDEGISSEDPLTLDLAQRILTIPNDHRYDTEDIVRMFNTISAFTI